MHVLYNLRHCCSSPLCPTAGLPGYVMRFALMPSGWSPQEPLAHLYEQQENIDTGALAGFSQQVQLTVLFQGYVNEKAPLSNFLLEHNICHLVCLSLQLSRQPEYSKQVSHYSYPPTPPMSYFSSGTEASGTGSFPNTQLNRVSLDLLLLQLAILSCRRSITCARTSRFYWKRWKWGGWMPRKGGGGSIINVALSVWASVGWLGSLAVIIYPQAVGMPPVSNTTNYPPVVGNAAKVN